MSEEQSSQNTPPSTVEFVQYHQPPLKDGNYRVKIVQTLARRQDEKGTETFASMKPERTFTVAGPRYRLDPEDILSVYPPADTRGDHSNVLPHVVLRHSTLPWEREAEPGQREWPWLALLLFDEAEAPTPQTITLRQLETDRSAGFPGPDRLVREPGEHDDDRIAVIDVPVEQLDAIMPAGNELALLAHVRRVKPATTGGQWAEHAVVLGNRLARRGRTAVAHLVSVENRYRDGQFARDGRETVRLVSLKSWRYACRDETSYMVTMHVAQNQNVLRPFPMNVQRHIAHELYGKEFVGGDVFKNAVRAGLGPGESIPDAAWPPFLAAAVYKKLTFRGLLKNLDQGMLRLPEECVRESGAEATDGAETARAYLRDGYVLLSHHLRNGRDSYAWYRGPLLSREPQEAAPPLPVRAADELLRYDRHHDMYDASYAAAWELGRLLALQDRQFSLALFNWKRSHARALKALEAHLDHLPFSPLAPPADVPPAVARWFEQLSRLHMVPFNYLVPDERMLPPESIRFFQVDPAWVACLLDGAFTVGRVSARAMEREPEDHPATKVADVAGDNWQESETVSGFLLRSDVIAGWPHLQVDGYDIPDFAHGVIQRGATPTLPVRRMERLSDNVLLCLFAGKVMSVDIHQKPEGLHAGVDMPDEDHTYYTKHRRDVDTGAELHTEDSSVRVPFRGESTDGEKPPRGRVLDIAEMARRLRADTSAAFALQMIEGVQAVRFTTVTVDS